MISPRITRAAYPMNRGRSGKQLPSRSAMSRYASCNSVVTLGLAGDRRRASSRFAIRCNSEYRVLNSSSAAAPSPHSASLISEEIVGPTRHLPIDETPQSAFQRRAFPRGSQGTQLVQRIGRREPPFFPHHAFGTASELFLQ